MSFRNATQQQEAIEAARVQQAKRDCIAEVFSKYPTMVQCEANARKIIEDISFWAPNTEILPTFQLFQSMLDENPDHIKTYATQPVDRTKEQIREEIISLLQAHSRRDDHMLKSEESRMKSWDLSALRIRLAELKTKTHMVSQPVSELKQFVADSRPSISPFPGFATLPKSIWRDGRTVTIDADYLNHIAKHDKYEFVRICKIYGSAQVDSRRGIR